jgi:hypothetical protein
MPQQNRQSTAMVLAPLHKRILPGADARTVPPPIPGSAGHQPDRAGQIAVPVDDELQWLLR